MTVGSASHALQIEAQCGALGEREKMEKASEMHQTNFELWP